jgi:hypothetical protein
LQKKLFFLNTKLLLGLTINTTTQALFFSNRKLIFSQEHLYSADKTQLTLTRLHMQKKDYAGKIHQTVKLLKNLKLSIMKKILFLLNLFVVISCSSNEEENQIRQIIRTINSR